MTVNAGQSFSVSAAATDPGDTAHGGLETMTYSWDLNGDGVFGDATGASPSYTLNSPGTYNDAVQVSDGSGGAATRNFTVTATPEPASLSLLALGGLALLRRGRRRSR